MEHKPAPAQSKIARKLRGEIERFPIPSVLYHGTRNAGKIQQSGRLQPSASGEFGPGVYLASDPGTANFYASHVSRGEEGPSIVPVTHELENPFFTNKLNWVGMTQNKTARSLQAKLKARGHDGIVAQGLGGGSVQVVAFEPDKLKLGYGEAKTNTPS